jgi:hypothetical protein
MSTHLKLLALASAAMLALPAVGHAANFDLVENSITDWTLSGSGFNAVTVDSTAVGTPSSFSAGPFTPVTEVSFTGAWADSTDTSANDASGKEFVIASATNHTVVAELVGAVNFNGATGTFTGQLYLGQAAAGDTNPFGSSVHNVASIFAQGGTQNIPFSEDGSEITINTSAIPEPGTFALLGTGLLGLGAAFRRRQRLRGGASPKAAG